MRKLILALAATALLATARRPPPPTLTVTGGKLDWTMPNHYVVRRPRTDVARLHHQHGRRPGRVRRHRRRHGARDAHRPRRRGRRDRRHELGPRPRRSCTRSATRSPPAAGRTPRRASAASRLHGHGHVHHPQHPGHGRRPADHAQRPHRHAEGLGRRREPDGPAVHVRPHQPDAEPRPVGGDRLAARRRFARDLRHHADERARAACCRHRSAARPRSTAR